jgi:hypothetical protein
MPFSPWVPPPFERFTHCLGSRPGQSVEKAQKLDIYTEFRDYAGEKPLRITTDVNLSLTL